MSARHFQKPKQINSKDGKVGIALLVTLAYGHPTSQALVNESYVPSTEYDKPSSSFVGPQSQSVAKAGAKAAPTYVLTGTGMYRYEDIPEASHYTWTWMSHRLSCFLQIIQATYVEKRDTLLSLKHLGELYTPSEFIKLGLPALGPSPYSHSDNEGTLMEIVDQLISALDERDKEAWSEYKEMHDIDKALPGPHGHLHKYFHAAQWLFARANLSLLNEHRNQCVKLARLLGRWTDMYLELTDEDPLPSGWSLVADAPMKEAFTAGMERALAKLNEYLRRRHACRVYRFRLSGLSD